MMTRQEVLDAVKNAFNCMESEYATSQAHSNEIFDIRDEVLNFWISQTPSGEK
jgi:hypothetical protein